MRTIFRVQLSTDSKTLIALMETYVSSFPKLCIYTNPNNGQLVWEITGPYKESEHEFIGYLIGDNLTLNEIKEISQLEHVSLVKQGEQSVA